MRGLSDAFMADLREGALSGLLLAVQRDDALCLEIREECINVYYRGGSLIRIKRLQCGEFRFYFNPKYFKTQDAFRLPHSSDAWLEAIPRLKAVMDIHFFHHPKGEREAQQMILRENNNSSIAKGTDYYITDLEYRYTAVDAQFDLIAAKWLSTSEERKHGERASLSIIELKYGLNALSNTSGLQKHVKDVLALLQDKEGLETLIKETNLIFKQKRQLELIRGANKDIMVPFDGSYELLFLIANAKPISEALEKELRAIRDDGLVHRLKELKCELKLAKANCMGYGLYADCMDEV